MSTPSGALSNDCSPNEPGSPGTLETPILPPLPPDLAGKILWFPPFENIATSVLDVIPNSLYAAEVPATFSFHESIVREAKAVTSNAFSHAAQMASIDTSIDTAGQKAETLKEPIVSLYYPHQGCHEIIDAMVKLLAQDQGAEVVVVDSMELALAQYGIFGEAILHAVDIPVEKAESEEENDRRARTIQQVFHAIVNISLSGQAINANAKPKPRIVYMRDFGAISQSAKMLFPYLVEALRVRRLAHTREGELECQGRIQPTVLVLGFAQAPQTTSWGESQWGHFSRGGESIKAAILPALGSTRFSLSSENLPRLPLVTETFFFQSLKKSESLSKTTLYFDKLKANLTADLTAAVVVPVLPACDDAKAFANVENNLALRRNRDVRNAWLKGCLERQGAILPESSFNLVFPFEEHGDTIPNGISMDDLQKHTQLHLAIILDRLATLALGIARSQHDTQMTCGSTGATVVTGPVIFEAYETFITNWKLRSDWARSNTGAESEEDESSSEDADTNKEENDDIVTRVKKARDLKPDEKKLLECIVEPDIIATSFDDVCLPEETINSIRTVISLPLLHPAAFNTGILQREAIGGVLLYGSPGTGKTMLCRAIAREGGAQMLQIKPSDILSKWVGESEKLVASIFSLAYRLAPCIVFIDEMDSLFRARQGDDRHWERDTAMDGLRSAQKNREKGIIVVGATNRPYDLDDAVLRRLPTRILVELPTENQRFDILKTHLKGETLSDDVDLAQIARETPMYSGSDLKNLCVCAAMESVKEAIGNFTWKQAQTATSTATDAATENTDVGNQTRKMKQAHFYHALGEVSASSAKGSHFELYRWHESFGGKKKGRP